MRSLRFILIAFLICLFFSPIEAQEFMRSGQLLRQAGLYIENQQYSEAILLADSLYKNSKSDLVKIQAIDLLTQAYDRSAQPGKTEESYLRGLNLFATSVDLADDGAFVKNEDYQRLVFNYANFLSSMGRYEDCLQLISKIDFPEKSEAWLRLMGLKAMALRGNNQLYPALSILNETLHDSNDISNLSPTYITLLNNRGFIFIAIADYDSAIADLSKVVKFSNGKNREVARSNLALAIAGTGNYGKAIEVVDKAVENLRKLVGEDDIDYIIALRKKAEILAKASKIKYSAATFKEFFELEKNRLEKLLPEMTPNMRLNYWTVAKPMLSRCFIVGEHSPEFAFDVALMRRETSLLSRGNKAATFKRLGVRSKDLAKHLSADEALVSFVSYPNVNDSIVYAAITLNNKGISKFIPLFNENFIYEKTHEGKSIYECLVSEDSYDKWVIYNDTVLGELIWRPIIKALPWGVKNISFAPEGVFHLLGIENLPFNGKSKFRLSRKFSFADIVESDNVAVPSKPSEAHRTALLIGGLNYDDISDSIPARSDYSNHEAYNELKRVLRYPNPSIFSYLPGTRAEVNSSAVYVDNSVVKDEVTEDNFKAFAPNNRLIHIATHGYSLDCGIAAKSVATDSLAFDISMLRSAVALSGANVCGEKNDFSEDGILSAREICDLDLSNVDMVVLSACQTAKGLITDESASGLIRAFKIAGVNTIVASLWEVDDNSTAMFMRLFYKELSEGADKYSAFQAARDQTASYVKRAPIRKFNAATLSSRPTDKYIETVPYSHPWFWAPFIMIDP